MHKSILLKSLVILCYSCIFNNTLWAKTTELPFDGSFYMTQICTDFKTREDQQYCNNGYLLKSETLSNGQVKETVSLNDIGHYGWNHITINKIDADTYHVYVGCGNPCGANMLFGRGDKEQYFDRYFDADIKSKCTVAYDSDKNMWVAHRFFSDKAIKLPSTYGIDDSKTYPTYKLVFDKKSILIMTDFYGEKIIKRLPNPCIVG